MYGLVFNGRVIGKHKDKSVLEKYLQPHHSIIKLHSDIQLDLDVVELVENLINLNS